MSKTDTGKTVIAQDAPTYILLPADAVHLNIDAVLTKLCSTEGLPIAELVKRIATIVQEEANELTAESDDERSWFGRRIEDRQKLVVRSHQLASAAHRLRRAADNIYI